MSPPATAIEAAEGDAIPLFDARYRWVLRRALGKLRTCPGVDLDNAAQMDAAYGILRTTVERSILERKLADKLDAATVAALANDKDLLSTVGDVLLKWLHAQEDVEAGSG